MLPYNMKGIKIILLIGGLFSCQYSPAQYSIKFMVKVNVDKHLTDSVFLAGNFNNWQPDNSKYVFTKKDQLWMYELKNVPKAVYEFKCTRGSWQKVECNEKGENVDNHLIVLSSDTTFTFTIDAWKDDFTAMAKVHTASSNVYIIDTAFYMPQLDRKRRIWIYLPSDYGNSKKRYPVMYMHDGQNIFDDYTSGYGEWGVDECLDSLIKKGAPACIVVGIDNGPQRMNEYNPYFFDKFGDGQGDRYVDFLAQTLKPFIDQKYRTIKDKRNTIIAGSSMGGLISYYAMLKYPNTFGKGGIFSPAFWTAGKIKNQTAFSDRNMNNRFFFYVGKLEGDQYVNDMKEVVTLLKLKKPNTKSFSVIDPNGRHNEATWRKWFPQFYSWIIKN